MLLMLMTCALITSGYYIPIEVQDYPYGDDPVYLTYREAGENYEISLASSPDSAAAAMTNYASFPGLLNAAKTYAYFEEDTRTLTVISQYPFSANYFMATYRFGDDGYLVMLEAEGHDYYMESLQQMQDSVAAGNVQGAVTRGWDVMYPGGNYYAREMIILLLSAGVDEVKERYDSGVPLTEAMEILDSADGLAYNLINNPIHMAVLSSEQYPEDAYVTLEEYREVLAEYAFLLEKVDEPSAASEVRNVLEGLQAQ